MDPVEKAGRRKSRRPRVIAAGVVYMLLATTVAVILSVSLLVQIAENHTTQLKELSLLQEHSQLLHAYENAAAGIGILDYNEGIICGAFHLSCKPVSEPVVP